MGAYDAALRRAARRGNPPAPRTDLSRSDGPDMLGLRASRPELWSNLQWHESSGEKRARLPLVELDRVDIWRYIQARTDRPECALFADAARF